MNKTKQPKKVVTEKVKISGTDKKNINNEIKIEKLKFLPV
jgi:hypothetical protein